MTEIETGPSAGGAGDFWRGRAVFVTGATGCLGGWLIEELNRRGAVVVGLVRDVHKTMIAAQGLPTQPVHQVAGRLEDHEVMLRAINEYEIDTVFHLGAQPIVGIANRHPLATFETNIRGTWNLLEACRQVKTVKRVVVASSDKAYGIADRLPYDETMPLKGSHPYDVSKSCTDLIARTYFETYGLPVCITRCGNFYGGRDLNWNRIVPSVIRSVLQGERPVLRSDGTMVRDYIYIRDVVRAYLLLAERMGPGIDGEAFNLSSDRPLSVLDITRTILDLMGVLETLPPVILNEAKSEIPAQYLTAAKARRLLGWQPQWSLRDGLRETIDWYRDHLRQAKPAA
ncbi:MAG: GDP-mannose 4,6-dehydratase [Alphaproteobacteria bacterium]|nr:GDP-mannose 4,6-dehydratase [Alphaproteobacteria bacterium]